jgi:transcription-repair coupling factor (superfamily II helicase)
MASVDLGLVIIDEEQRFGEAQKRRLREMRAGVHALTMTATPLPRTLQAAAAGLMEVSVLATPPAARQPVRSFVLPFDPVVVRTALRREFRRGGQSFVVCPRIEDIGPMAERLGEIVPELRTIVAHGRMKPDALDQAMLDFASGQGDVLLATNIVEAGLDIPNANTMLVWRADRFGLAQLHQLRGRVGRSRARASAYLLTDPAHPLGRVTEKRLSRLAALDQLGSGFAISAADLDLRGGGDLLGEEQAGHLRLIGTELYRHLLSRALTAARGEEVAREWRPEITFDIAAYLPEGLVPEPDVRLELYRRLARLGSAGEIDAFGEELEDRFGQLPAEAMALLDLARLRLLCRALGIGALAAGPQAVAVTPVQGARLQLKAKTHASGERVVIEMAVANPAERLQGLIAVLEGRQ